MTDYFFVGTNIQTNEEVAIKLVSVFVLWIYVNLFVYYAFGDVLELFVVYGLTLKLPILLSIGKMFVFEVVQFTLFVGQ